MNTLITLQKVVHYKKGIQISKGTYLPHFCVRDLERRWGACFVVEYGAQGIMELFFF